MSRRRGPGRFTRSRLASALIVVGYAGLLALILCSGVFGRSQ